MLDPIPHVHDPERDGGVAVAAVPIVVLSVPDAVDLLRKDRVSRPAEAH